MAGEDVVALNQQDRDRLKELHGVIRGRQKPTEAARHLASRALARVRRSGRGAWARSAVRRPS
jgi:hypothetical protein